MSVSMRFLDELDILPKNLRQSIAQFMAHVHGSVNDISKVWKEVIFCVIESDFKSLSSLNYFIRQHCLFQIYLQNDRRYNYTTPKSFLELINLYVKILTGKHEELNSKIIRLGNGLEKLRITNSTVRNCY